MRTLAVPAVVVAAVLVAAAAEAAPSTTSPRAVRASCSREVRLGHRHYRSVRLPPGALRAGARLPGRGRLQCEPALVCHASGGCVLSPGRVVRELVLRRIHGVKPFLGVLDARSGQIYVNRQIFTGAEPAKSLLRDLRKGGGPQPDYSHGPPKSRLLSRTGATVALPWGSYCWSTPSGDQMATGCADLVSPTQRFDLPLVIAKRRARIRALLGFQPSSVQIALLGRDGAVLYSRTLATSQAVSWTIPKNVPARSFLEIGAGRAGFPQDSAAYLARLNVTS